MTMEFISPRAHAVLDYASITIQAVAPRLLGLEPEVGRIHKAVLATTAGYSLLTDYPGGAYKVLPMKTHLAIDALAGIGFLAAAITKRRDRLARSTLAGMGLLSLVAAFCTRASERPELATRSMSGLPAGSESPMQRYARERRPGDVAPMERWPKPLQRQVMRRHGALAAQP